MDIVFEWDPRKSRSNLRKHGVGFEETTSAFFDPLSLTIPDLDELEDELRWQLLGGKRMKKGKIVKRSSDQREEYDFRGGIKGKYADRVPEDVKMVVLEPDVARAFKSPRAVNKALRAYLAQRSERKRRSGAA